MSSGDEDFFPLGKLFGIIERDKHGFNVKEYAVTPTTLEQIFNSMTRADGVREAVPAELLCHHPIAPPEGAMAPAAGPQGTQDDKWEEFDKQQQKEGKAPAPAPAEKPAQAGSMESADRAFKPEDNAGGDKGKTQTVESEVFVD